MSRGALGKQILGAVRYEDVEVAGVKLRVRQLRALRMLVVQSLLPKGSDKLSADALFAALHSADPALLPELIAESCTDPETGEPAFTSEDAAQLPGGAFLEILMAVMRTSGAPEAAELKA